MSASANFAAVTTFVGGRGALAGILLAGGCLNGVVSRMGESWQEFGPAAAMGLFGLSPLEVVVAVIAVAMLARHSDKVQPSATGLAAIAFAAAVLVPSVLASWLSVLAYGTWVGWRSSGPARCGALLLAGMAFVAIWGSIGDRSLGQPLIDLDAKAVGVTLAIFGDAAVERAGNVVGFVGGHKIVVLNGCSTIYGLPLVLLVLCTLYLRDDRPAGRRLATTAAMVATGYAALNLTRLTVLGLSPDLYAVGHGPVGTNIFDGTATVLTLLAAEAARWADDRKGHA